MAFNKQSEAQMRNDLQSALNDATAPPPDYISTENVTTMQPGSRGAPNYGDIPSPIPTFTPIYTNQNPPVGPKSVRLRCPQCKCMVESQVRHRSTTKTHLACLLLTWTGCCCCLPYCMDTCRNANHFCPMCGTFIGTYES
ncbi:lipopolysaccharide-induced tumor necrosis factor-alpha factor-like [Anastrepha obliqua]|uniref:lipopolysaccharide-induced tumor necrosis factor-alpha factor-like n=1 Tax=Anastrepha obliqua TaxID=95512 RepID=UPI00240A6F60|nr:lipopolysaccharide-induced tumor necrosis factor-alpha factor-like [Anastrepha obliqua]